MNKFIIVSLCAFVAVSSGEKDDPLEIFVNGFDNFKIETICNPVCGSLCAAQKFLCISIPNVNDCELQDILCNQKCGSICDCVTDCGVQCEELNKCPKGGDKKMKKKFEKFLCKGKQNACRAFCQGACPGKIIIEEIYKVIDGGVQQIEAFISQFPPAAVADPAI